MILLGVILLILGLAFGIGILDTIGVALLVIGVVLFAVGSISGPVGGRRHWF
jgi:hypothetical protein